MVRAIDTLALLLLLVVVTTTYAAEVDPAVVLQTEMRERYGAPETDSLTDCFKTDRKLRDKADQLTRLFGHMRCVRNDEWRELMVGVYVTVHDMRRPQWLRELHQVMQELDHLAYALGYGFSHALLHDPLDLDSQQGAQFECDFGDRSSWSCQRARVIAAMCDAREQGASFLEWSKNVTAHALRELGDRLERLWESQTSAWSRPRLPAGTETPAPRVTTLASASANERPRRTASPPQVTRDL
jgi:hypothetical protein